MPESPRPQRRDVAQAVEITAALPRVARGERHEIPIRARSHRVATLCGPVLKVGGTKETASNNYKAPLKAVAQARQIVGNNFESFP